MDIRYRRSDIRRQGRGDVQAGEARRNGRDSSANLVGSPLDDRSGDGKVGLPDQVITRRKRGVRDTDWRGNGLLD